MFERAPARTRDTPLVGFVIEVRLVAGNNYEQRNGVMRGSPQRRRRHEKVAITEDGDGYLNSIAKRQRRTNGHAWTGAEACAAVVAEPIARSRKSPYARGPLPSFCFQLAATVAVVVSTPRDSHLRRSLVAEDSLDLEQQWLDSFLGR
jgi:hypothetical protein